ncbi:hypothetical protein NOR51B_1428 [Luminiphilus syltensis NOR5-1B]|uniref:Uncharacterized protein n=1 Tax=Luminiphilus syltensis NOR5-1B TaxID=565045 RepID=B8KWE2_9GAMM|nr:hypothetical protein NOR51B_1428 [Luminiphilus syltensis NOR5-1B]
MADLRVVGHGFVLQQPAGSKAIRRSESELFPMKNETPLP